MLRSKKTLKENKPWKASNRNDYIFMFTVVKLDIWVGKTVI